MNNTHFLCVFIALGIQHAMRLRHIFVCGLPRCTVFFPPYLIKGTILEKKNFIEYQICVSSLSTTFVWNIFRYKKNWVRYDKKYTAVSVYITLHSFPVLMKLELIQQIFEKYSNIKFHEDSSRGNRIVPCGETDGRTDMTKLMVAFGNFTKAPKDALLPEWDDISYITDPTLHNYTSPSAFHSTWNGLSLVHIS